MLGVSTVEKEKNESHTREKRNKTQWTYLK